MGHAPRKRPGQALTVSEVAVRLGIHNDTVKNIPPAQLPYFTVTDGGYRRYLVADLDAFITSRKVTR